MSGDLRQLLHDTAPGPARPVDAAGVVRKARRQKVALRVAAGLVSVVVIAAGAVGLSALWPEPGPRIVDRPTSDRVTAQIGVLERPAGPDDALPDWVAEELEVDPEAAATARLARRSPGRTYYLYADDSAERLSEPAVCVAVVYGAELRAGHACGPRQVPTRTHALVVVMADYGTVGIVPDGIATAREIAGGDQLADVPVVNNLFIDPAPPGTVAMEGRSDGAFCAAIPEPDAEPADVVDADDPMELLEQMATTAPVDIADDVYMVWDDVRVRPGAIQGDDVDVSEPVQAAATRVDDFISSTCGESATSRPPDTPRLECLGDATTVHGEIDAEEATDGISAEHMEVARDWLGDSNPGVLYPTPPRRPNATAAFLLVRDGRGVAHIDLAPAPGGAGLVVTGYSGCSDDFVPPH